MNLNDLNREQRLAAEKSYVDEISKTLIKKKIQMEEFNHE